MAPRASYIIVLSVSTPHYFGNPASAYLPHVAVTLPLLLLRAIRSLAVAREYILYSVVLHYCPRQRPRSILELEIRPQLGSACRRFSPGANATAQTLTFPISHQPYQERGDEQPRGSRPFSYNTRIPPFSVCQQGPFEMRYNRRATQH
jgi:hypothetical protein